ncbi:hypothetical protein C8R45DRAFT_1177603 [Mycena sanguinolenta]|nr:hypothetical protein C8R45DRAFT_1177603 [Mycena sanguinolenta]
MDGHWPIPAEYRLGRSPTKLAQTGSHRPTSPEPALHAGERAPDSTTKSPHTNRVIKRGKTDANAPGSHQETTTTMPDRTQAPHNDADQSANPNPTPFNIAVASRPHRAHFGPTPVHVGYRSPNHSETKYQQPPVAKRLAAPHKEQKTTATTTYAEAAEAAKASSRFPVKRAQEDRPSQTSKYGNKRPQKKSLCTRLVLDFNASGRAPPPADLASPAQICAAFNEELPVTRDIKAVTRTRTGNWILHTDPAQCDARTLMQFQPDIVKALGKLRSRLTPGGRFTEEPLVYPAEPWHGVVVHGVPLADGEPPDINDLFDEMGVQNRFAHASGRVAGIPRWMWPHDKPLPSECQGLSIRLSFYKEADASRFIRQGMFLFRTLCQVSKYRPRRSTGER